VKAGPGMEEEEEEDTVGYTPMAEGEEKELTKDGGSRRSSSRRGTGGRNPRRETRSRVRGLAFLHLRTALPCLGAGGCPLIGLPASWCSVVFGREDRAPGRHWPVPESTRSPALGVPCPCRLASQGSSCAREETNPLFFLHQDKRAQNPGTGQARPASWLLSKFLNQAWPCRGGRGKPSHLRLLFALSVLHPPCLPASLSPCLLFPRSALHGSADGWDQVRFPVWTAGSPSSSSWAKVRAESENGDLGNQVTRGSLPVEAGPR